ncbi:MAG: hypothetical protein K5879_09065 [Lachnospiraceae bacterium]|nr:hypothetical protein [Lachnospiraceae bacterium]
MITILRITYITAFVIVLLFALMKKKNLSFVFIYFLSSTLFYFNAFEGEIFVGKLNRIGVDSYPIYFGTYIVLLINLLMIFLIFRIEPEADDYVLKHSHPSEEIVMKVFIVSVFLLSAYMCIRYGVFTRSSLKKSELAEETGKIATYYKYLASFSAVYVLSAEDRKFSWKWVVLGMIPIFTTFLFGNRSYLVVALVAILFDKMFRYCRKLDCSLGFYLAKHKLLVIAASALLVVTLVIKGITSAIFSKNFAVVFQRLTSVDYYKQVFFVSEPNTIMTNLNTIVASNFQVEKSTYSALWAYPFPLITGRIEKMIGVESFTKMYQKILYVTETNRASTMLGEAFANGGYIVVALVVLLYLVLLMLVYRGYRLCSSNIAKTTLLLIGMDAAFYVQRNSMAFEFSRFRDYIFIAVILYVAMALMDREYRVRI